MKRFIRSARQIYAITTVLSALGIATYDGKASPISNEFWISTNRTIASYGTLKNPFDGSNRAKFDSAMNHIPENATVHLLPGTYHTRGQYGGYGIKTGQKILGSGMDVTVLQFPAGFRVGGSGAVMIGCNSPVTNVEICDLTCDCNALNDSDTYNGIIIGGDRNAVRRVKVINCHYQVHHSSEAFGIVLADFAPAAIGSQGNLIEECEVSHFNYSGGGGISALSINRGSGIMRNNRVFLDGGSFAFNGAWSHDVLIVGNHVENAISGLHGDTGGTTNLLVMNDTFIDCDAVCDFNNTFRANLAFAFNDIIVSNTCYPNQALGFVFRSIYGGGYTNLFILGNTLGYRGTSRSRENNFIQAGKVTGLVIANNTVDSHLTNNITGSVYVSQFENKDIRGNYRSDLNTPIFDNTSFTSFGVGLVRSVDLLIF